MNNNPHTQKRIINVSNRLPVKINFADGKVTYQNSEGGLATGLGSVFSQYENIWIGWPGAEIADTQKQKKIADELQTGNLYPIFLDKDEIENFYEGFSNEIIWPLFHYFPTYSVYSPEYWDSYVKVNQRFANEILKFATEDDTIWIQDYHLMLVPEMLRSVNPNLTIGYFQHIPFPSFEIFKALPWKEQIVKGLLGADTIGFQTENDAKHFRYTVTQLDSEFTGNEVRMDGHTSYVGAFPISIDYKKFKELAAHHATKKIAQKIKRRINTKILISIDRLDYSKGIIQRLKAYELFLREHPEYRQKVTYIHLIVPSRENVNSYKELKEEMNKLISDINGKYATFGWQPICHFYRSFPPNILTAIYKAADIAMVTPLRDGMNLVSKEFVASNTTQNGVLILSENAGAANELTESLTINPNDVAGFADSIYEALNMPAEKRMESMLRMQQKIEQTDIFNWAKSFLNRLEETREKQEHMPVKLNPELIHKIDELYTASNKRLILLDYDGTVVPFFKRPEDAYPNSALLKVLQNLAADTRNDVVIISGRDNVTLDKWLGHLPVKIIAEHGAWFKDRGQAWQKVPHLHTEWKEVVNKTFEGYSQETPGTFIEEKAYSLAWHYRAAEPKVEEKHVKEMVGRLKGRLDNDLDVLQGNKVIEVKNKSINKGNAVLKLISKKKYDFVMAIGDDKTDEDMFRALPEDTITIKVGYDVTAAAYYQPSYREVNMLLKGISEKNGNTVTIS